MFKRMFGDKSGKEGDRSRTSSTSSYPPAPSASQNPPTAPVATEKPAEVPNNSESSLFSGLSMAGSTSSSSSSGFSFVGGRGGGVEEKAVESTSSFSFVSESTPPGKPSDDAVEGGGGESLFSGLETSASTSGSAFGFVASNASNDDTPEEDKGSSADGGSGAMSGFGFMGSMASDTSTEETTPAKLPTAESAPSVAPSSGASSATPQHDPKPVSANPAPIAVVVPSKKKVKKKLTLKRPGFGRGDEDDGAAATAAAAASSAPASLKEENSDSAPPPYSASISASSSTSAAPANPASTSGADELAKLAEESVSVHKDTPPSYESRRGDDDSSRSAGDASPPVSGSLLSGLNIYAADTDRGSDTDTISTMAADTKTVKPTEEKAPVGQPVVESAKGDSVKVEFVKGDSGSDKAAQPPARVVEIPSPTRSTRSRSRGGSTSELSSFERGLETCLSKFKQLVVESAEEIETIQQQQQAQVERKQRVEGERQEAAVLLAEVEKQQAHAVEQDDFELADQLNDSIETHRATLSRCEAQLSRWEGEGSWSPKSSTRRRSLTRESVGDGTSSGTADQDGGAVVTPLQSRINAIRDLQHTFGALRSEGEDTVGVAENKASAAWATEEARLQAEEARVNLTLRHLESDEAHLLEEEKQTEEAVAGQTVEATTQKTACVTELREVEAQMIELKVRLAALTSRREDLEDTIKAADEAVKSTRNKFNRQLSRLAKRREVIEHSREEANTEVDAIKEDRLLLEASQTAAAVATQNRALALTTVVSGMDLTRALSTALEAVLGVRMESEEVSATCQASLRRVRAEEAEAKEEEAGAREALASVQARLEEGRAELEQLAVRIPALEAAKKAYAQERKYKDAGRVSGELNALGARQQELQTQVGGFEKEMEGGGDRVRVAEAARVAKSREVEKEQRGLDACLMEALRAEAGELKEGRRQILELVGVEEEGAQETEATRGAEVEVAAGATAPSPKKLIGGATELLEGMLRFVLKRFNSLAEGTETEPIEFADFLASTTASSSSSSSSPLSEEEEAAGRLAVALARAQALQASIEELQVEVEAAAEAEDYDRAAELDERLGEAKKELQELGVTEDQLKAAAAAAAVVDGGEEEVEAKVEGGEDGDKSVEAEVEGQEVAAAAAAVEAEAAAAAAARVARAVELKSSIEVLEAEVEAAAEAEDYDQAAELDERLGEATKELQELGVTEDEFEAVAAVAAPPAAGDGDECDPGIENDIENDSSVEVDDEKQVLGGEETVDVEGKEGEGGGDLGDEVDEEGGGEGESGGSSFSFMSGPAADVDVDVDGEKAEVEVEVEAEAEADVDVETTVNQSAQDIVEDVDSEPVEGKLEELELEQAHDDEEEEEVGAVEVTAAGAEEADAEGEEGEGAAAAAAEADAEGEEGEGAAAAAEAEAAVVEEGGEGGEMEDVVEGSASSFSFLSGGGDAAPTDEEEAEAQEPPEVGLEDGGGLVAENDEDDDGFL